VFNYRIGRGKGNTLDSNKAFKKRNLFIVGEQKKRE